MGPGNSIANNMIKHKQTAPMFLLKGFEELGTSKLSTWVSLGCSLVYTTVGCRLRLWPPLILKMLSGGDQDDQHPGRGGGPCIPRFGAFRIGIPSRLACWKIIFQFHVKRIRGCFRCDAMDELFLLYSFIMHAHVLGRNLHIISLSNDIMIGPFWLITVLINYGCYCYYYLPALSLFN